MKTYIKPNTTTVSLGAADEMMQDWSMFASDKDAVGDGNAKEFGWDDGEMDSQWADN